MSKMRGQAAMEYLMTYGWALLILVVVIGVLFSMGVFNPQNYMSEECSFQPSLPCKGTSLTSKGVLTIYLTNGLGYAVDSFTMNVDGKESSAIIPDEDNVVILKVNLGENYKPYDIYKFKPVITYVVGEESYTISGTVTVRASE
jgi:hypothetical protein